MVVSHVTYKGTCWPMVRNSMLASFPRTETAIHPRLFRSVFFSSLEHKEVPAQAYCACQFSQHFIAVKGPNIVPFSSYASIWTSSLTSTNESSWFILAFVNLYSSQWTVWKWYSRFVVVLENLGAKLQRLQKTLDLSGPIYWVHWKLNKNSRPSHS